MILVIGGAYQGKLDFILEKYNYKAENIFTCTIEKDYINFEKEVINNFQDFVLKLQKEKLNPLEHITENINKFENKIIICDDIFCGIVPIEKEMRIFREELGRCLNYISKYSDKVYRVFCGIGSQIK